MIYAATLALLLALECYIASRFDRPARFTELTRFPGNAEAAQRWRNRYNRVPLEIQLGVDPC